jgi:hypothetical protein
MASVVEICNAALISLGADTIASLTDDTKEARLCNQRYTPSRDAVLRAHPWNCASKRANVAPVSTSPIWGYDNAFNYPSDCLRVLGLEDPAQPFVIEGKQILSDATSLYILYVAEVTDPNVMDSLLRETISARMAAELCYPITGQAAVAKEFWEIYERRLTEARGMDAQESFGGQLIADTWLDSRK